jgi:peptidoglycan/xylan/chitin deacetylase (PgdA/CDA1 family)
VEPDRVAYSPIIDRPPLVWPDGARLALWVVPNLEFYELEPPPHRERNPWPRMPPPDVQQYGARDYGNRVGLWRLFEVMDRHEIRCTVSLNLALFEHFPELLQECETRHWDYLCHGIYNTRYLFGMPEDEEAALVKDCVDTYRRLTGRRLAGWLSPGLTYTLNTPDLVAEHGIKYYCDWVHDDQPVPMRVRGGQRLITLPYSVDLNDTVMHRQGYDAEEFSQVIRDQFDTLYEEGGRVMCIALHPYVSGQPHRIKLLDEALAYVMRHEGVWQATGEEIADWYYASAWDRMAGGR